MIARWPSQRYYKFSKIFPTTRQQCRVIEAASGANADTLPSIPCNLVRIFRNVGLSLSPCSFPFKSHATPQRGSFSLVVVPFPLLNSYCYRGFNRCKAFLMKSDSTLMRAANEFQAAGDGSRPAPHRGSALIVLADVAIAVRRPCTSTTSPSPAAFLAFSPSLPRLCRWVYSLSICVMLRCPMRQTASKR